MQEEIQRIHVIVSGLFEIKAVRSNLLARRLQDHLPPALFPASRMGQIRKQRAQKKQGDRFPQQMRVR